MRGLRQAVGRCHIVAPTFEDAALTRPTGRRN
jgi:hypothetical protein